ncbi:helix-turn-helix domain-containing protein [Teredinibacter turnerae]|uniref:helix-turn-helix domain-containing protein n=1 Tax=Teredinibacter turnerae TaxID=2426 RepID=UPI0003600430|nr:helix-turn-helix transcriptional regulator [Teredinibacter turnerae]
MINRALKLIRQFHEMTQQELAEKLDISKSYLSELESGKKTVSYELIEKYSKIFDISASSLVFFSESISSDDNESKHLKKFRQVASNKVLNILEWFVGREKAAQ